MQRSGFNLLWPVWLVVTALVSVPWSAAQQPERGPGHPGRPAPPLGAPQTQGAGHEAHFGPKGEWHGRHGVEEGWQRLFRPSPEDQGPLKPGEEDELVTFAKEHTPRIYRALDWLRQRNPDGFRQKLAENAPRLRHLRRVYERSPQLGRIIETYAESLFEIQRDAAALQRSTPGAADYERDVQHLRDLVSANVRLESDALETLAKELEEHRSQRVENRVTYLIGDEAELTREPEKLRDLITAFRAAATDAERETLRGTLREAVTQQVTNEIQGLRDRVTRMRAQAAEETDRRLARLLEVRPERGEGPPGKRPGPGRGK